MYPQQFWLINQQTHCYLSWFKTLAGLKQWCLDNLKLPCCISAFSLRLVSFGKLYRCWVVSLNDYVLIAAASNSDPTHVRLSLNVCLLMVSQSIHSHLSLGLSSGSIAWTWGSWARRAWDTWRPAHPTRWLFMSAYPYACLMCPCMGKVGILLPSWLCIVEMHGCRMMCPCMGKVGIMLPSWLCIVEMHGCRALTHRLGKWTLSGLTFNDSFLSFLVFQFSPKVIELSTALAMSWKEVEWPALSNLCGQTMPI